MLLIPSECWFFLLEFPVSLSYIRVWYLHITPLQIQKLLPGINVTRTMIICVILSFKLENHRMLSRDVHLKLMRRHSTLTKSKDCDEHREDKKMRQRNDSLKIVNTSKQETILLIFFLWAFNTIYRCN